MNFSTIIESHFKSIFKLSVLIGICTLIAFGSVEVYKARQESKSFIISQVREMAVADVNAQTLASLDGELNRIIKLWSLSEDFPFRVEVLIDGKLWARGGQLRPFSWPFLTDQSTELLPAGTVLKIEAHTYIGWVLLRFGTVLLVFGAFFMIVFATLRRRIERAVKEVTRPLEARVKKITEISENLTNIKDVTLDMESNDINEVQAIDSSLKQLVGRIVTLEDGLAEAHFAQGRVEATEDLAHTMKGTIASYQLALQSSTLSDNDKSEFESVLEDLKRLSSDVLHAKRAESDEKRLARSEIDANNVINNVLKSYKSKVEKQNLKIRFELTQSAEGPILLNGPSAPFERSITDLVTNAVESIEDEGNVAIRMKPSEGFLDMEIQDNGRGIPEVVLPTVMTPGVTFGKKGGDGLGLSNAKKSFEAMGGTLNIFSELGKGTTVKIRLPLKKSKECIHDLVLFPESTLVIVDDDVSIHKFFSKKLAAQNKTLKIVNLLTPMAFEEWMTKNRDDREFKQFIFDVQFDGNSTSGINLIEKYKLFHESVIISGVAHKKDTIIEAARLKVRLIHKDDLDNINIKLEETEETYQKLIS